MIDTLIIILLLTKDLKKLYKFGVKDFTEPLLMKKLLSKRLNHIYKQISAVDSEYINAQSDEAWHY